MGKDEQILIRLTNKQNEAIEKFAEDREYNKAEAGRKILVSRLVGDGYLDEGIMLSDGGTIEEVQQELEGTRSELNKVRKETRSELNKVTKEIEEFRSKIQALVAPILVSLLWIGVEVSVGIPEFGFDPWITAFSGFLLIVWVLYAFLYPSQ